MPLILIPANRRTGRLLPAGDPGEALAVNGQHGVLAMVSTPLLKG
jgi:hypothetical protein